MEKHKAKSLTLADPSQPARTDVQAGTQAGLTMLHSKSTLTWRQFVVSQDVSSINMMLDPNLHPSIHRLCAHNLL